MLEREIRVTGSLGLHARAAANLVRIASNFRSNLTLKRIDSGIEADAKSILSVLMLAASRGTDLRIVAQGTDEVEALDALVGLFSRDFDENIHISAERSTPVNHERRYKGLGVSQGVAIGRVLRLQEGTREVYRAEIAEADLDRERKRFRSAVTLSRKQLESIKTRAERELGRGHAYIFDAHLLLLDDAKLSRDVEDCIVTEHANAEWAAKVVGDRLLSIYNTINDEYLRERGSDIEDVIQRLLANLLGEDREPVKLTEDAVIVSQDLLPSTIAELDLNHVTAIATDAGGWTSHMAIIARGLGLTAVVGLRDFYQRTRTGDAIIVDARRGEVILHPTTQTVADYQFQSEQVSPPVPDATSKAYGPVTTRDGVRIELRANVELPAEFEQVQKFGASGVGLFRSEFLLSRPGLMMSEDAQYSTYVDLARASGPDGAVVRLFDVGGEGGRDPNDRMEKNPALGLRAIRFGLRHKDVMLTQVKAILRAASVGRLSLVIPMVADVSDVRKARQVIAQADAELKKQGMQPVSLKIGAMLEVPSAVLTAEKIAREVDFFELGTNDLVQYTLAVDRGNDDVAAWFRTLHPAVLFGINHSLRVAKEAGIPVIVCGEMASTPAYAVLLAGLGAVDLSMTPAAIPRVRNALASIDTGDASSIVRSCLDAATADDVEEIVRREFTKRWSDLFPPEALPATPD